MTSLPFIAWSDNRWVLQWDTDKEHLEIEFLPDGMVDWYYRDRVKDISEGTEDPVPFCPSRLAELIQRFEAVQPAGT